MINILDEINDFFAIKATEKMMEDEAYLTGKSCANLCIDCEINLLETINSNILDVYIEKSCKCKESIFRRIFYRKFNYCPRCGKLREGCDFSE